MSTKKLYTSSTDKKIAGVCGGIAEYFEIDSAIVRIGAILLVVLSGVLPGVIAYFAAALIMPERPKTEQ